MLEVIAQATRWIHFENYIIRSDKSGQCFADALIARARDGINVRVLYERSDRRAPGADTGARSGTAGSRSGPSIRSSLSIWLPTSPGIIASSSSPTATAA